MRRLITVLSVVAVAASVAAEETPAAPSPPPVAPSPAPQVASEAPRVKLGAQIRLRPECRNGLRPDAAGHTSDIFAGQRARATLSIATERVQALVEVQDARNWGTEASTVSNEGNADLHQAYLTLPDLAFKGVSLTVGRQELIYGDERLLGALDWATNARSFDGGVLRYGWKGGSVDLLGALVNDRRTAARGTGDVVLAGAYGRFLRSTPGRELDVYALNLGDGASVTGEGTGRDETRITTLGARARYAPVTGPQASAEAAFQTGHRGPDDHTAHALALTAGYVFNARHRPALRVEWDRATGDGDSSDGRSREFNNLFPTNHGHYGFVDIQGWRNMDALRGTVALTPRTGHLLSVDVHQFRLREARGAWKDDAGEVLGQDPTGTVGRDIGRELDLLYRFPARKQLTVLFGYSLFFPGRFAETVRGEGTQHYGYAQLLFKF